MCYVPIKMLRVYQENVELGSVNEFGRTWCPLCSLRAEFGGVQEHHEEGLLCSDTHTEKGVVNPVIGIVSVAISKYINDLVLALLVLLVLLTCLIILFNISRPFH